MLQERKCEAIAGEAKLQESYRKEETEFHTPAQQEDKLMVCRVCEKNKNI